MWRVFDYIFWVALWISSAGVWVAVTFFEYSPDPKSVVQFTFLGMMFVASASLRILRLQVLADALKRDKP